MMRFTILGIVGISLLLMGVMTSTFPLVEATPDVAETVNCTQEEESPYVIVSVIKMVIDQT